MVICKRPKSTKLFLNQSFIRNARVIQHMMKVIYKSILLQPFSHHAVEWKNLFPRLTYAGFMP
jgi:hypothetical protein